MKLSSIALAAILLTFAGMVCACHSYQVDAVVENRTGAPIDLLEVDYPSASFGADSLASGADYRYRFQIRLGGPVKVQYTEAATHTLRQITGPDLHEGQQGRLQIVLLPDGKAEFHTELTSRH